MSRPLVSIIVPAYNAAPWLRETLDCAVAQTWKPCEIIVVDDGSTDATAEIAWTYSDRGVRMLSQPNRGLSAARNAGLREAQGDFVQYLDADDLLSPDKVEQQLMLLATSPPASVATGRWSRFRADPARARLGSSLHWRDLAPLEYLTIVSRTGSALPVHAWLLPRGIVDRIGPFATELRIMEDHEYFARVALASSGLRFCDRGLSYYRSYHAHTLSKERQRTASTSAFRSVEMVTACLLREDTAQRRQIAADYFQWLIFKIYPERPDLVRRAEDRVRDLGGSTIRPRMGRRAMALARIIGWKLVQRLRAWLWRRGIYLGKHEFISD